MRRTAPRARAKSQEETAYVWLSDAEGTGGVTVGKLVCGLRVVSEARGPCTGKGALVRGLLFFVDGLFVGLVGYAFMKVGSLVVSPV